MCLAVSSRTDMIFAASLLATKIHKPCIMQMRIVKKVVRYLKVTNCLYLFFSMKTTLPIDIYCDADWAACLGTRMSTNRLLIKESKALIMSKNRKQTFFAVLFGVAENFALYSCNQTITWWSRFVWEVRNEIVLDKKPEMYTINFGRQYDSISDVAGPQSLYRKPKNCSNFSTSHKTAIYHFCKPEINYN